MAEAIYAINEQGRRIKIGGTLQEGKKWMRAYNKNYGHKHKGKAILAVIKLQKKPRRIRQRIRRVGGFWHGRLYRVRKIRW